MGISKYYDSVEHLCRKVQKKKKNTSSTGSSALQNLILQDGFVILAKSCTMKVCSVELFFARKENVRF